MMDKQQLDTVSSWIVGSLFKLGCALLGQYDIGLQCCKKKLTLGFEIPQCNMDGEIPDLTELRGHKHPKLTVYLENEFMDLIFPLRSMESALLD